MNQVALRSALTAMFRSGTVISAEQLEMLNYIDEFPRRFQELVDAPRAASCPVGPKTEDDIFLDGLQAP